MAGSVQQPYRVEVKVPTVGTFELPPLLAADLSRCLRNAAQETAEDHREAAQLHCRADPLLYAMMYGLI